LEFHPNKQKKNSHKQHTLKSHDNIFLAVGRKKSYKKEEKHTKNEEKEKTKY
jgi:hypothetical protein